MANFMIGYRKTATIEGGYSNNPNDRGGETFKGISRKNFPNWPGWSLIDDLKRTTGFPSILINQPRLQDLLLDFYKKEFWDALMLDYAANQEIANELYDTAVNCGTGVAGTFLQRVLNVSNQEGKYYKDLKVDGQVGSVTISALNSHPKPLNILKALNALQGAKYISICEANPSQEAFFNGWMNRVNEYCPS